MISRDDWTNRNPPPTLGTPNPPSPYPDLRSRSGPVPSDTGKSRSDLGRGHRTQEGGRERVWDLRVDFRVDSLGGGPFLPGDWMSKVWTEWYVLQKSVVASRTGPEWMVA